MANVTNLNSDSKLADKTRARSDVRFPVYGLGDSVSVAKVIHDLGGGKANPDQLAAFLNYKSTTNGAYLARVGAARLFGLVNKSGDVFVLTPLAQQILMPTYPEQSRQGLVTAFLNVDGYRRVYDEFKGKELPPEFGMKNALRNTFGVVPSRIDIAYRVLMDSAQDAGFFTTRGSRTHLVIPSFQSNPPANITGDIPDENNNTTGGGSGGSGGGSNGANDTTKLSVSMQAVKARYIQTLINTLEEKGKNGELDEALMSRIEKLLENQT